MDSKDSDRFWNVYVDKKVEEIEALLEKWLFEMDYKVEKLLGEGLSFRFVVENGQGNIIQVFQSVGKRDLVVITGLLVLPDRFLKRLSSLDKSVRGRLFWNLRFTLLDTQLGFKAIDMPLKSIELSALIYFDGLTKDRFAHELSRVRREMTRVFWMIAKELGEPEPAEDISYIG